MCLNVLYCFPETWDLASGRTDETDYRGTRFYQYMLRTCTLSGKTSEVATHPHRQFFGIERGQFKHRRSLEHGKHWALFSESQVYGLMPIEEFLVCGQQEPLLEARYRPREESEVTHVRSILCGLGLPVELVLDIMDMAGYEALWRLKVPDDPLHWGNKDQLVDYLKYCWILMIRSDIMAKALGMEIPWKEMVSNCLIDLLGCVNCSKGKWYEHRYIEGTDDCTRFL